MSGYVILKALNEETKEFYLESFKFHKWYCFIQY